MLYPIGCYIQWYLGNNPLDRPYGDGYGAVSTREGIMTDNTSQPPNALTMDNDLLHPGIVDARHTRDLLEHFEAITITESGDPVDIAAAMEALSDAQAMVQRAIDHLQQMPSRKSV
jgi:hypothetical protein